MKYPMDAPFLDYRELRNAARVLKQGWLSAQGDYTERFERGFAKLAGCPYALAVQSGTAALQTALMALGAGPGRRVVLPAYACSSCLAAVLQTGAEPVIIDVETDSFGMSAERYETVLKRMKVFAVIPVHTYGFPCRDIDSIVELSRRRGVWVLEDACEALGASHRGRKAGSLGDIAVFSLRSDKMIGVGEGGVVVTGQRRLMDKARQFANRGVAPRKPKGLWWEKYRHENTGMNYLLPNLLSAIGAAQLEKFSMLLRRRIQIGEMYRRLLKAMPEIGFQKASKFSRPCYWRNAVLIRRKPASLRKVGVRMTQRGVEVFPGFWPLSDLKFSKRFGFEVPHQARRLQQQILVLPSSVHYDERDFEGVRSIVRKLKNALVERA